MRCSPGSRSTPRSPYTRLSGRCSSLTRVRARSSSVQPSASSACPCYSSRLSRAGSRSGADNIPQVEHNYTSSRWRRIQRTTSSPTLLGLVLGHVVVRAVDLDRGQVQKEVAVRLDRGRHLRGREAMPVARCSRARRSSSWPSRKSPSARPRLAGRSPAARQAFDSPDSRRARGNARVPRETAPRRRGGGARVPRRDARSRRRRVSEGAATSRVQRPCDPTQTPGKLANRPRRGGSAFVARQQEGCENASLDRAQRGRGHRGRGHGQEL